MPNQSCTIILNGHGYYKSTHIMNLSQLNINYNIIFIDKINKPISNALHNFLLNSLVDNIGFLNTLESIPTTYVCNQNIQQQHQGVIDMSQKRSNYVFDHNLKNAPDVVDVQTLKDINPSRFCEQNHINVDYNIRHGWQQLNQQHAPILQASFKINYDINQIKQDVLNAYQQQGLPQPNSAINLSQDNIVFITPTATNGESFAQNLSDFMTDILPKIKIPVLYSPPSPQHGPIQPGDNPLPNIPHVQVSNVAFLDDGTLQNRLQTLFPNAVQGDIYHEMTIAGDANIIWDACRDFAE